MRRYFLLALLLILLPLASAEVIKNDLSNILSNSSDDQEIPVIIRFKEMPTQAKVDEIRNKVKVFKNKHASINAVSAKITKNQIDSLLQDSSIEYIEPDYEVKLVLDKSVVDISAPQVWEAGITGNDIDVAVIDTGIDSTQKYLGVERAIDFTGEGTQDFHGHGTHVAGIIASTSTIYTGVAFDSDLFNVKVLNQYGVGYSSDVIKGIDWAVNNGAEIISLSLGAELSACDGTDALSQAVDSAVEKGVVAIVAAGNSGPSSGTINSPGCAKNAITIGAINDGEEIASFSSRGPTADGRTKPDIVAPGVSITSTWINNGFASLSGTSMATPHISGVTALLLEKDNSLSPQEIKEILMSTAKNLQYDENTQGAGKVESYLAYLTLTNQTELPEEPGEPEESKKPSKNKTDKGKHLGWIKGKKAGLKPDSLFYPFERILERVDLALTFNESKKLQKQFEYAGERLAEANELATQGKSDIVTQAIKESQESLNKADEIRKKIKEKTQEKEETITEKDITKKEKYYGVVDKESSEKSKSTQIEERIIEETKNAQEILGEIYRKVPEQAKPQIQKAIKESAEEQKEIKQEIKEIKNEPKVESNKEVVMEENKPVQKSEESKTKSSTNSNSKSKSFRASSDSSKSLSNPSLSSSSSGENSKSKDNSGSNGNSKSSNGDSANNNGKGNSKNVGKIILDFFSI